MEGGVMDIVKRLREQDSMIDPNKTYQTKSGHEWRYYGESGDGQIHGAYKLSDGTWRMDVWKKDGTYVDILNSPIRNSPIGLVEVKMRIKLLAEQAGFLPYNAPGMNPVLEKFAELIVKECVGVVEGGRFLHDQAPTALFAKECSSAIKEHFGVEQ